jgi:hypothetical protein
MSINSRSALDTSPLVSEPMPRSYFKIIAYVSLPFIFALSVIGWNVNNLINPNCELVRMYQICDGHIHVCDFCDNPCMSFFKDSRLDYIGIMIILYWISFILILSLWLFIVNDAHPFFIDMVCNVKRIRTYLFITTIMNTICHFIGTGIVHSFNKPVAQAMPFISLYTIYIGFMPIFFVLCVALLCLCLSSICISLARYINTSNTTGTSNIPPYYVI